MILRRHQSRSISSLLCVRNRSAICDAVAEQRLPDKIATLVFNSDDRSAFGIDLDQVAAIDPQMTLPDAIRALFINPRCLHRGYSATKRHKMLSNCAIAT